MEYSFRKAKSTESAQIWTILKDAIRRRKEEGSEQWQDGYPNPGVIESDILKGKAYVLTSGDLIAGYCSIGINDEPEYDAIKGEWSGEGDYVVYHRLAVSAKHTGQGLAQMILNYIEDFARSNHIKCIRADTNHDNARMLKIFQKQGYRYCGEVSFRGSPRMAFEKLLD